MVRIFVIFLSLFSYLHLCGQLPNDTTLCQSIYEYGKRNFHIGDYRTAINQLCQFIECSENCDSLRFGASYYIAGSYLYLAAEDNLVEYEEKFNQELEAMKDIGENCDSAYYRSIYLEVLKGEKMFLERKNAEALKFYKTALDIQENIEKLNTNVQLIIIDNILEIHVNNRNEEKAKDWYKISCGLWDSHSEWDARDSVMHLKRMVMFHFDINKDRKKAKEILDKALEISENRANTFKRLRAKLYALKAEIYPFWRVLKKIEAYEEAIYFNVGYRYNDREDWKKQKKKDDTINTLINIVVVSTALGLALFWVFSQKRNKQKRKYENELKQLNTNLIQQNQKLQENKQELISESERIDHLNKELELKNQKLTDSQLALESEKATINRLNNDLTIRNSELQASRKHIIALKTEMSHRIKNDLQTIASGLKTKNRAINNQESNEILKEAIGSIDITLGIHEMLQDKEETERIELQKYIYKLLTRSSKLFKCDPSIIELAELRIQETMCHFKVAQKIGFIIYELITNSYKHSPSDRKWIKLSIWIQGEYFHLSVQDKGHGYEVFSEEKNNIRKGNFILNDNIEQLEGILPRYSNNKDFGTTCLVKIPLKMIHYDAKKK